MNFTPKSENECNQLLPTGEYGFEIVDAVEKTSKAGADMIELKVKIYGEEENAVAQVFDYLLESVAYKLRHCANACGLLSQYETGNLEAGMLVGKTGRCKIKIQQDKTGQYPDKNTISDYVKKAGDAGTVKTKAEQPLSADSDLQF